MWNVNQYTRQLFVSQVTSALHIRKSCSCVADAGIDVTANQDDELTDKETFQIEFDTKKDQWRVRTADNVYWKLADASGIQSTDDGRSVMNGMRTSHSPHRRSQDIGCGGPLISIA